MPPVNFFLCLVLVSPISKKDYYKKQTAQYMNTNCGSALIYKPTYPLKRLRRNVQVCTPFEAFSLTFENSRAARKRYRTYLFQRGSKGVSPLAAADRMSAQNKAYEFFAKQKHSKLKNVQGCTFLSRVLRGLPKVCNADFGRRVLGSSPKTSHDWNQRRTGRPPRIIVRVCTANSMIKSIHGCMLFIGIPKGRALWSRFFFFWGRRGIFFFLSTKKKKNRPTNSRGFKGGAAPLITQGYKGSSP